MKYEISKEPEFLQILIGRCWKILRLYEEHSPTLPKHINNTIFKFKGVEKTFDDLNGRIDFLNILVTLNQLHNELSDPVYNSETHCIIKSQVFDCTNALERFGKKTGLIE